MRRFSNIATVVALVLVLGCVVIPDTFNANITVTIRHIEEQADQILDYVEGKTDSLPGLAEGEAENTSLLRRAIQYLSPIQVAYAAELNQSSPRIKQIATQMKNRFAEVQAAKSTGAVGESNRGLLELVKPDRIGDSDEKNRIQRVIAADNDDRKALYKEVARINKDQNLTVSAVERVYAQERLGRAKAGDLYQLPPTGSDFDKFKNSAAGKRLGAQCVAGGWATIK